MPIYKPILEFRPLKNPVGGAKEITLKFLTPHNKWSTHSQQMLTLFRGGTHNTPTHMIGGYGQLLQPTGNQRDIYIVARKMEEVD